MIRHSWIVRGAATVGLLALSIGVTAFGRSKEPICKLAEAWAISHRTELATTYEGLSEYSISYRKAAYRLLPKKTQLSLWHTQFNKYIAPNSKLTVAQRQLVQYVDARLEQFMDSTTGKAFVESEKIDERIKKTFPLSLGREIFATLGPSEDFILTTVKRAGLIPDFTFALRKIAAKVGLVRFEAGGCDCSFNSNYCNDSSSACLPNGCGQESGCGTFWLYTCTGLCYHY